MLEEFKKFAFKGNVVDMAVGVILGAAFGNVVKGLTDYLLMPVLGLLTGGLDFGAHFVTLKAPPPGQYANADEMVKAGAVLLRWGAFANTVTTFLLIAIAVFFLVKAMNRALAKEDPAPAEPTPTEKLLEEIRDLLKAGRSEP